MYLDAKIYFRVVNDVEIKRDLYLNKLISLKHNRLLYKKLWEETMIWKAGAIIKTIIKENCGHHPHGLEDNMPIIDFVKKYDVWKGL